MNNILELNKNCCGCTVCAEICPQNSISFQYDNEGFLYPVTDNTCVDCGLCKEVCPVITETTYPTLQKVYAAKLKDSEKTLIQSTSGGVFAGFAMEFLSYYGVVFGCALNNNLMAYHLCVDNYRDVKKLQGSKYVQSDTRGIYKEVKKYLNDNRYVLYSGTPCQIAALKSYLKEDYPKLLTMEIVCHGVPSPKLFENYLMYLEVEAKSKIKEYYFRHKKKNGKGTWFKYTTLLNSKVKDRYTDPYYYHFVKGNNLRESCYNCKFSSKNRVADITIGDYTGIPNEHPEFDNSKGVSTVIINTEKGQFFWNQLASNFDFIESTYQKASNINPNLLAPTPRPEIRDEFYKNYNEDILKYFGETLKPPFDLKRTMRKIVPQGIRKTLKKVIKKA